MSRRLEMTEEVHDWLVELQEMRPPTARLVGEALLALLDGAPDLGPPLVVAIESVLRDLEPGPALDDSYQRLLTALQKVRRGVADVATSRKRLALQIAETEALVEALEETDARRPVLEEQLSGLRRLHDEQRRQEERITRDSQRLQARIDAFRVRKETVKAAYDAARASARVERLLGADGTDAETELAKARSDAEALRTEAREMEAREMEAREVVESLRAAPAEGDPPLGTEPYELRLAALTGHDVRMLFAFEPPDTVVILTVAIALSAEDIPGRWWEWYEVALDEAKELLSLREPGPSASPEVTYVSYDRETFLDALFPGSGAEEMTAAASRLVARNRVHHLVEVRRLSGFSQAQVAERMGVEVARVAAIEDGEPGAIGIGDLTGYVEALGGRLDVVAELGGERIVIV